MDLTKFTTRLNDEMASTIGNIIMQGYEDYELAHECYKIVQSVMIRLRDFIQAYRFRNNQEEILFFKEIKPAFHSELLYYIEMMHIHALKPSHIEKEKLSSFLKKRIQCIHLQMENYQHIYMYYRTKRATDDERLFLRSTDYAQLFPEDMSETDPNFTTVTSTAFAKIIAWEKLLMYLNVSIENLDQLKPIEDGGSRIRWTHSKVALIELAYALHSSKAINLGKIDVKQIINALETTFNIELGNFYRVFQNIRIRQAGRTAFMDELKSLLEKRMDDTDMGLDPS